MIPLTVAMCMLVVAGVLLIGKSLAEVDDISGESAAMVGLIMALIIAAGFGLGYGMKELSRMCECPAERLQG